MPYQSLSLNKLQGLNIIDRVTDDIKRSLSSQEVPLKALDEAIKFTISFDVANGNEHWALVSKNDADTIRPEIAGGSPNSEKWIYGGLQKQGITPQWSFICTQGLNLGERSEILRLSISNIKTTLLAGYANLYVHYENIPGYWDGHITVPIHKGPLVYREYPNENTPNYDPKANPPKFGCVGIGTDKPQAQLHVKKDASLPLALSVEGDVKIAGELAINDYFSQNDNYVQLSTAGDYKYKSGIRLKVFNDFFGFTIEHDDRLDGQKKQGLNVLRHENSTDGISAVFIERATGNIGIGVTDPNMSNMTRTLAIARGSGGIYGIAQNNSGSDGWRMSLVTEGQERMTTKDNGNLGIGTTDPQAKLHIVGSLTITNGKTSVTLSVEEGRGLVLKADGQMIHGSKKFIVWDGDENWDFYK